jgi:hypothetical protein
MVKITIIQNLGVNENAFIDMLRPSCNGSSVPFFSLLVNK